MPTLNFANVSIELLAHPGRAHAGIVHSAGLLEQNMTLACLTTLEQAFPGHAVDEIDRVFQDFCATYSSFEDWIEAALGEFVDQILFEGGQPAIQSRWQDWRRFSQRLDVDCMLLNRFVNRYGEVPKARDLARWGVFVISARRSVLDAMDRRYVKLYDTHTHLEGCESVPGVWIQILHGVLRPRHLMDYCEAALRAHEPGSDMHQALLDERIAIGRAIEAWTALCQRSDHEWDWDPLTRYLPSDTSAALWPERLTIANAWKQLLDPNTKGPIKRQLRSDLSDYMFGKQVFVARFTQFGGGNPGLTRFRRYFDRARNAGRPIASASGNAIALQMPRWQRMSRFALESRRVEGIELRISPFETIGQYEKFFGLWQSNSDKSWPMVRRLGRNFDDIRENVSFIVHFTRSRPRKFVPSLRKDLRGYEHLDHTALRRRLDFETSTLHGFRQRSSHLAQHLVGIDVANLERHGDVEFFSSYLRLLRDPRREQWSHEERSAFDRSPYTKHWRRVLDETYGCSTSTAQLQKLGLTYHCGEDFHHPLQGLMSVWGVMNHCGTTAGDRIGHGLALGYAFSEYTFQSTSMPQGVALDVLVWLRRRLGGLPGIDTRTLRVFDDDIASISGAIYGQMSDAETLYDLQRLRHMPLAMRDPESQRSETLLQLYDKFRDDDRTAQRFRTYIAQPAALREPFLVKDAEQLRNEIIRQIHDNGLILEINPTSNLSIAALNDPKKHPIFRILETEGRVRFTINCDDPGTFSTRIENEYALIDEAIEKTPPDARDALRHVLDQVVETSERAAFGRPL